MHGWAVLLFLVALTGVTCWHVDSGWAGPESTSRLYSHDSVKKYVVIFNVPQPDFRRSYLHFLDEETNTQVNRVDLIEWHI